MVVIYLFENLGGISQSPSSFSVNGKTYAITAYENTPTQREMGLMNATVTNSTFVLFHFPQSGIYPFWMKNTYSQLDIIWLNYSSSTDTANVVYIANAIPCASYSKNQSNCVIYTPNSSANYVLEAKGGFAKSNDVQIGSSLKFDFGG